MLLAALLTAGALTACSGGDDDPAPAKPAPRSIRALDVPSMRLARVAFCDLVPAAAVRAAVGVPAGAAAPEPVAWGNGDPVPGAGAGNPGHENGCAWTGPGGTTARAWVFARPVDLASARSFVRTRVGATGCPGVTGLPFGEPSVTLTCARPGGTRLVRHAGLFTDTWLTCEVRGRLGDSRARRIADRWCAAVATALDKR
jgi:hypothetical protein